MSRRIVAIVVEEEIGGMSMGMALTTRTTTSTCREMMGGSRRGG
jgi:hypothetical protein